MKRHSENEVIKPHKWFYYSTIYGAEDGEKDTPYMTRVAVSRLRLHIFHRGDQDPDPHDHPWGFWTFPLISYIEEVFEPATGFKSKSIVEAFTWHYRPAEHAHRVLYSRTLKNGWLWTAFSSEEYRARNTKRIITIVWSEQPRRHWGFWKGEGAVTCWEPWKKYIFGGGKGTACLPPPEEK